MATKVIRTARSNEDQYRARENTLDILTTFRVAGYGHLLAPRLEDEEDMTSLPLNRWDDRKYGRQA